MASNTPRPPEKISADCPHCGFSQLESAYAKSTFCRKCGEHYSIEKLLAKEAESLKGPSIFDKVSKLVSGEKIRDVSCFSCGNKQQVSSAAQSSQCAQCGSYIDLRDFKIAGPFGRSIQTQGEVVITTKGDVAGARIACATALVEGKLRGTLVCTGTARMKLTGRFYGGIDVHHLLVEKKSDVEFSRTVKAHAVEIHGKVTGHILCSGCVTIMKAGELAGTVHAKSVNFEKGSLFNGELVIGESANETDGAVENGTATPLPDDTLHFREA